MRIAVPTKHGNLIDSHFGHCKYYCIFTIKDGKVIDKKILESPQGCGCKSNIASDLAKRDVTLMLAGGIGDGAMKKLTEQGIDVIRNCEGDVDVLVENYLVGNVLDGGENCAAHGNDHSEHGHVCSH